MNREIKFRAFIPERKKKGMLVATSAYMATQGDPDLETLQSFIHHYGDCENLMQYIGRKDKNGKEIYEGDILKVRLRTVGMGDRTKFKDFNMPVFWNEHEAGFDAQYPKDYGKYRFRDGDFSCHEIIGNIYENPELIKP